MLYNAVITVSAIYRYNQRAMGNPPTNKYEEYIDKHFNDDRMKVLFPHMRDSETLEELNKDK